MDSGQKLDEVHSQSKQRNEIHGEETYERWWWRQFLMAMEPTTGSESVIGIDDEVEWPPEL
ncbi:hypothetical protein Bca101_043317 [Brassica carinata]